MTVVSACHLVAMAAVLSGPVFATAAQAQAGCDWYAKTALKQQQDNQRLKCGLKGASWSHDLRAHEAWCGSVRPDLWKAEARKRAQDLSACARR